MDLDFPQEWKGLVPRPAASFSIDNRRTLCDHCSLRRDLPGFISEAHVNGNIKAIESGKLFPCHMIHNPTHIKATHNMCLGAALVAGAELDHPVSGTQPPVYDTLEEYRQTQVKGRREDAWLVEQDDWKDESGARWFGWWAQAPVGNWHYLMSTLESNRCESVYLFFNQCEELYGPLEKMT
jgi:hypothetical protein